MKILHVGASNFAPGGVATYVQGVVEGQRAKGHEVHVAELWPGACAMAEVPLPLDSLDSLERLRGHVKPDVVHLHALLPSYTGVGSASVMTTHEHAAHCASGGRYLEGKRRICDRSTGWMNCLWGHYVDHCGSRHPQNVLRRFQVTNAAPSFAGRWVAPSAYSRDQLIRRGIPQERVHHIPNPLNGQVQQFDPNHSRGAEFLFLGRLVANKGCDVLIEAMALVPTAVLKILGEGPLRSSLEQQVQRLGLAERVSFLGWASPENVAIRLRAARALVVPSVWPEPFGLVALEAYREYCPVVASRVGGLADLVQEGITGRLVPPGNAQALAIALTGLLEDPAMALKMGVAGHSLAQDKYLLAPHLDALDAVYQRVGSAS